MRFLTISLFLAISLLTTTAIAQSEHGHSHGPVINEDEAKVVATKVLSELVETAKIDKSWATLAVVTIEQKTFDGHLEWVVTFQNDTLEDQSKRTLYIFLTLGGEYLAANYTGE